MIALIVDSLLVLIDTIAIGLSALLVAIILASANRYREIRFLFVGIAIAVLGVMALVGLLGLLLLAWGAGAALGTIPSSLLVVSEVLLYLSFVSPRSRTKPTER